MRYAPKSRSEAIRRYRIAAEEAKKLASPHPDPAADDASRPANPGKG